MKPEERLKEKVASGWKVRVCHLRDVLVEGDDFPTRMPSWMGRKVKGTILPQGGTTFISARKDKQEFTAMAACNPIDNFCYRTGITIAAARIDHLINNDNNDHGNTDIPGDVQNSQVTPG